MSFWLEMTGRAGSRSTLPGDGYRRKLIYFEEKWGGEVGGEGSSGVDESEVPGNTKNGRA